ncbi:MAG TPA: sugar phosphate isomerase/epimerase [Chthoniobacterales bacterium]|jgi:D-psicose/D-tagatose/L-ribulose 3-epimerase|nr:sugar phosphate isomerase/epimerase [Chthoniobacterales bacterium]
MKIGMNLLLWTTHVTEEHYPQLEKIKSTGFDGVEIPIFGGEDAHYQKLRKKLDELQLKTSTVAVATPEANAISPDPAIRKAASERLKTIVRQSAILGADILCGPFHQALGVFSGTGPTEEEFKLAADVHREAANEAQRQGVCLAIEFLNRFECYFLNTTAAAAIYVRRVAHPNFKAMFDTFHANIEEENLPKAFRENAAEIAHIHVANNDRGVPGRGHIDFPAVFRTIKTSGYNGWLTIEAFGRALPELVEPTRVWRDFFKQPDDVVTEGYRFIRDTWNAV